MAGAFSSAFSSAFDVGGAPPGGFQPAWVRGANVLIGAGVAMQKNISGQKIGCQMVSASDGSAFTGAVTVSVTGDAGTQATGSVGAGACTHEGNGYHTYAPAQAETNYDLIAFTFTGSGAIPATVQVYTRWDANLTHSAGTAVTSSGGRPEVNTTHIAGTAWASTTLFTLASHDPGATLGTSTLTQTQVTGGAYALNSASFAFNAALDLTTTQKASVNTEADTALADYGALKPTTAGRTLDVSATGEAGVDWANVGSPTTSVALTGTTIATTQQVDVNTIKTQTVTCAAGVTVGAFVGQGTAAIGVNASGHVSRVVLCDTITTYTGDTPQTGDSYARIGATGSGLTSITADTEDIQSRLPAALTAGGFIKADVLAIFGNTGTPDFLASMVGDGSFTADFTPSTFPNAVVATGGINALSFAGSAITAAALAADAGTEIGTAVWASATRTLSALDEDSTTLDLDATIRAAVGLASANLDTQLDALPTAVENADALLGRNVAGGSSTGRTVSTALYVLRNKVSISGGTMTVYQVDDTTSSWTATLTSDAAAEPITVVDPAG